MLALTSLLKPIRILLLPLIVTAKVSKKEKAKLFFLGFLTFLFIYCLSWVLFPSIFMYYYLSITGQIEGQHSPIREEGGITNPAAFFLIRSFSMRFFGRSTAGFLILYPFYVCLIGMMFYHYHKYTKDLWKKSFLFGILAVMLIAPRLKPYSLILAIPSIYLLSKKFSIKQKFLVLGIISLFPLLLRLAATLGVSLGAVYSYNQLMSLFIIFLYFYFLEVKLWGKIRARLQYLKHHQKLF